MATKPAAEEKVPAFDFEVTNPDEVLREFMTVDKEKLRAAIAAGLRATPGVRILEN